MYVLTIDEKGGMLNDPFRLKLAEVQFWLSLTDYAILLWAKGLNVHMGICVELSEPDVAPLAVQGPKSHKLMIDWFRDWVGKLKLFWFCETQLNSIPIRIKLGWIKQDGYEPYLPDRSRGKIN